jgi:UDP-glucose 4-epimerase
MKFLVTGAAGFIGKRVVAKILEKNISVIATTTSVKNEEEFFLKYLDSKNLSTQNLTLNELDISSKKNIDKVFSNNEVTHIISCGYQMSNMIDANPVKGAEVNILGMTNLFESVVDYKIKRMIMPSSMSVYGNTQNIYGDKPVHEDDYCGLQHQSFTYAVMKILNEFMAQKYNEKHGVNIVITRPSVVFGFGRQRSSLMWAEDFATLPALGQPIHLPFPETNKDNFIYVEDCAEQMVQLCLKEKLNHIVYNTGSETASGTELAKIIKDLVPSAKITFDNKGNPTPFIDEQDDNRIRNELPFIPRSLKDGIKAHMNEARLANNLEIIE